MRPSLLTPSQRRIERWKGHLALTGQTLIICGGYVVGREAAQTFDPLFLTGVRAWGSALLYCLLLPFFLKAKWIKARWHDIPTEWKKRLFVLSIVGILFNQMLFNWGLRYTTAATTALIYALTPSVVYWLSIWIFRRESWRWQKAGALLLAYGGVVLALWHNLLHASHGWGWTLILMAVGFWAWYLNYSPPIVSRMGAMEVTTVVMIIGGVLHTPTLCAGLLRQATFPESPGPWWSLAYLIVGMSVMAYLLLNAGLRYLTPTQTALYISFQPIGTALLAAAFGQEPLTWQLAGAAALTTGGMLLFHR
ncbi:MAG: DMT family transporter [Bacteroidia bacterium]|nr:DMT family transporter [Bacteroidia bacterium]MDW8015154.1 DMT family transporter [Bacteroidia bacterium]